MFEYTKDIKEKFVLFINNCFKNKTFDSLFFVGIVLLLTWMPISSGARYLDTQVAGQVICSGLILLLIREKNKNIYKYPLWAISLFWLGILSLACIFSVAKLASIEELMRNIMYISMAVLVFAWSDSKDRMKLISYTVLSSGLVISGFAIFSYFMEYINTLSFGVASEPFGRTNDLGAYMLMIFPLALSNFLYENDEYLEKAFYALVLVMSAITIVLTFSRGIWLSSIVAIILILLLGIKILKKNIIYLGIVTVLSLIPVIIKWESIVTRFLSIQNVFNHAENSLEWRKSLLKSTVEIFTDNPVIGTGLNSFQFVMSAYQQRAGYFSINPHNYYLQLLAETGVMGFFTFIILVLSILYMSFKAFTHSEKIYRGIALGLLVSIISSLLHIAVDIDWSVLSIPMVFWIEVGLLIAIYHFVNFKDTRFTEINNRFDYLKRAVFIVFSISLLIIPVMNYVSFTNFSKASQAFKNEDYASAKIYNQRARTFAPYSSSRHNSQYAFILAKEKNYSEAINYIEKAISLDKYNYNFYKTYSDLLLKVNKNNKEDALEALKNAVKYNPYAHPDLYKQIGDFYIQKLNNPDEGIKWYRQGIEKFPVEQIPSYEPYTPSDRFQLYSLYKDISIILNIREPGSGKKYKQISDSLLAGQPKIESPYDNLNSTPTETIKNYWKNYPKDDVKLLVKPGSELFTPPPNFTCQFVDFIKIEHFIFSVKIEYVIALEEKNIKRNFIVVDDLVQTENGWLISSRSKKEDEL